MIDFIQFHCYHPFHCNNERDDKGETAAIYIP